jgi:RNA polymerase sigma factor (sigma-70 family)
VSVFPTTRVSVIERLRQTEAEPRREAFGDLVAGYWKPVYKYVRVKWRLPPEEAEDAAQAFFAEALEKSWFVRFDPAKARFRTFVRVCVDRLVMNRRQAAIREKRGSERVVTVDFASAEFELAGEMPAVVPDAEAFFEREFVRALFDRAVQSVRADCMAKGRARHWQLFERYDLADTKPSYATLAAEYGLTEGQVGGQLAQMRAAFRVQVVAALESLCADRDEFRREARALLGLEIE